jgi:hypothetical protein
MPTPVSVKIGTGAMPVRGLSLKDISLLVSNYEQTFVEFFASALNPENVRWDRLLTAAPLMACDIISLAGDIDADDRILVSELPLGVQVEILEKVWGLTVPNAKKLRSVVDAVIAQTRAFAPSNAQPVSDEKDSKSNSDE